MLKTKNIFRHPYFKITLIVLTIFVFKSNSAWVQHRVINGEYFVFNFPKSVPFMWQYDMDAHTELFSAAFFPEYYEKNPTLISRPTSQLSAFIIGNTIGFVITPIIESNFIRGKISKIVYKDVLKDWTYIKKILFATIGFIIFKILLYILAGILLYKILIDYSNELVSLFSVALLYFSSYSINAIATYHTYELEFITPIIVVFLFINICKSYSIKKNIIFSIIIGILMLGKANYAVYLAILIFSLFIANPKLFAIKGIFISLFSHLIPWIVWSLFLEMNGMSIIGLFNEPHPSTIALHPADIIGRKIFNHEIVTEMKIGGGSTQPGADFIGSLFFNNPFYIQQIIIEHIARSLQVFGTIWSFLCVGSIFLFKHQLKKEILLFLFIFLLTTWLQAFFGFPLGPKSRTLHDPLFIIYGFASFALYHLISMFANKRRNKIMFFILFIYIYSNFLKFVTFPWVHPFQQKGKYIQSVIE